MKLYQIKIYIICGGAKTFGGGAKCLWGGGGCKSFLGGVPAQRNTCISLAGDVMLIP